MVRLQLNRIAWAPLLNTCLKYFSFFILFLIFHYKLALSAKWICIRLNVFVLYMSTVTCFINVFAKHLYLYIHQYSEWYICWNRRYQRKSITCAHLYTIVFFFFVCSKRVDFTCSLTVFFLVSQRKRYTKFYKWNRNEMPHAILFFWNWNS